MCMDLVRTLAVFHVSDYFLPKCSYRLLLTASFKKRDAVGIPAPVGKRKVAGHAL